MKRRQFILSITGTAAAGIAGITVGSRLRGTGNDTVRVTRNAYGLGTQISLTVYHTDAKQAEAAIDAALLALDKVESVMSLYRPDSQISKLNRDGFLADPDSTLVDVLENAARLSAQTDGLFDVTVQPLWTLYSNASTEGRLPTDAEIQDTLAKVDWKKVRTSQSRIEFQQPGMQITLNGIAQGYAADAMAKELGRFGVRNALIDTGEINGLGNHADKDSWDIGLKHPRQEGQFLGLTALNDRCLATSGDYETRFGEGYRNHHLLDPRSGKSPEELSSVSVAASTALEADALSTAVFLLGLEKGRQLIESTPGADALFVMKAGQTVSTAGFPFSSIS